MVSCFKSIAALSLLLLALSCGKDGVAPSLSCEDSCRVFKDTTLSTGDFGSPAAADAKCMASPNYPGSGIFKALIVDGVARVACTTGNCSGGPTEHVDWVLRPNTEYRRSNDGAVIAVTDTNGLFPFNLSNSLTGSVGDYWSGLSTDWTSDLSANCNTWTSGLAGSGGAGFTAALDSTAIRGVLVSCSGGRLLCVEQ